MGSNGGASALLDEKTMLDVVGPDMFVQFFEDIHHEEELHCQIHRQFSPVLREWKVEVDRQEELFDGLWPRGRQMERKR